MSTDPPPSTAGGAPADLPPAEGQATADPTAAASPPPPGPPTAPAPPSTPPPPPPPPVSIDARGQARALFSQLDTSTVRPTAIVAVIIVALFFGAQLANAVIPTSPVGPGNPGPAGPGPSGPGPLPTQPTGPVPTGPVGPGTTPLPPGSTMTVGPLSIPLENGWVPQEVPQSNIIVRLSKGGVFLDVYSASIQGQADAATLYNAYIDSMREQATGLAATQPNLIQIGNGVPAARGTYTGLFGPNQIEGEVTTIVVGGTQGFIFDVWSSAGNLRQLLPEAERMIDNLRVQ